MICFNVGPSKVYPQIQGFLQDAYIQNVLSMPHRSQDFMDMVKKTIFLTKQKLNTLFYLHLRLLNVGKS